MIDSKVSKALRGIAIIIVIMSHYAGWMPSDDPASVRAVISEWGPYGVDIFFAISGYGLMRSAMKRGVDKRFILSRFLNSYLPYVITVGVLKLIQGGFLGIDRRGIVNYLIGYDYWYMMIQFAFYAIFICAWLIDRTRKHMVALMIMTVMSLLMMWMLYTRSFTDFWILSDLAFVMGVGTALAGGRIGKKSIWAASLISIAGMSGLHLLQNRISAVRTYNASYGMMPVGDGFLDMKLPVAIGFNIFFTGAVICVAVLLSKLLNDVTRKGDIVCLLLGILGEASLFIYLIHTAVYWQVRVRMPEHGIVPVSLVAAIIAVAVSLVLNYLWTHLTSYMLKRS
ncbi:MAG: acyltransferase [Lachnospiraceae bacterium]|nr:acyltransferase [Lachnospiraceae bacterium]